MGGTLVQFPSTGEKKSSDESDPVTNGRMHHYRQIQQFQQHLPFATSTNQGTIFWRNNIVNYKKKFLFDFRLYVTQMFYHQLWAKRTILHLFTLEITVIFGLVWSLFISFLKHFRRSHTDWLNRKVSHPIPHFQLNWIENWEGRISCNWIIWNFFSEMQLDQFIWPYSSGMQ